MSPHHPQPPAPERLLVLGETTYRQTRRRFGLLPADRLRHLWIMGKTGSGKSTLLLNLIAQDLAMGNGLALLDPHGDLVEAVLPLVPRSRINQVLLFAPEDKDYPVSYNPFRQGRRLHHDRALLASQLVSVFKRYWGESWGPRLEYLLRNAILAVAGHPQATMLFLYRFLVEEKLRNKVVEDLADPVVRQFWEKEFPSYTRNLQAEALSPVLNKLGAFVSHPLVRNIVSQERSRIDLIEMMGRGEIMLCNLATGRIGEDASHLLGGLLLTSLQLAAMERPRGSRPFYLVIDEFQHYAVAESLATMLAESRKFGLGLTIAHQYLAQLPLPIKDAVLGNVGSMVIFSLGGADASELEAEFCPPFEAGDLQRFPRYHVAVKLTARGEVLPPFSARTLSPIAPTGERSVVELIQRQSRVRFSQRREDVEAAVKGALL